MPKEKKQNKTKFPLELKRSFVFLQGKKHRKKKSFLVILTICY